ncbi:MAG: hypothetical protein HY233_10925 [Acidobacteriales bacterium]|nr:hypothetical protein [Terriglobales bacterium]
MTKDDIRRNRSNIAEGLRFLPLSAPTKASRHPMLSALEARGRKSLQEILANETADEARGFGQAESAGKRGEHQF